MKIRKAVITAAGPSQRTLPLQTLVDRDGTEKSALTIIVEEAQSAGVEEVCIVVHAGDEEAYAARMGVTELPVTYVVQEKPRGYGHALVCAEDFVGDEPFLHLVSDHLYVGHGITSCAEELVKRAQAEECAVSAVHATREHMLPYYGAVGGQRVAGQRHLYTIQTVREKPTPTDAEQDLIVPGLRAGHYLCFYGMHVLTPAVMELLAAEASGEGSESIDLSNALARLAGKERYLALEVAGSRYNIGIKYGLLHAQFALALSGVDREAVLTQLLELLAQRQRLVDDDPSPD